MKIFLTNDEFAYYLKYNNNKNCVCYLLVKVELISVIFVEILFKDDKVSKKLWYESLEDSSQQLQIKKGHCYFLRYKSDVHETRKFSFVYDINERKLLDNIK